MRTFTITLAVVLTLLAGCTDTPTSDEGASPVVGQMAPDFTQADTSGKPVTLSSFRGKVVSIDFWASWCGPCVAAVPHLKELWEQHRDKGLVVLSVSLDASLVNWRAFIRANQLGWTHVADGKYWNNAVARQYGVYSIPAMYLVGRDGKIVAKATDGFVLDEETVQRALD